MKIKSFFQLSLLAAALFLTACQGTEENGGYPELCYFVAGFSTTDCGDCCESGSIGFDLKFCDELGNVFTFGPYTAPGATNHLIALPSGHDYSGYVLSNGIAEGCTVIPGLEITIYGRDQEEVCTVYTTGIEERPEIWSCSFEPDVAFELAAVCDGCGSIVPPVDCCDVSAFGYQEPSPGNGTIGDLIVDVNNGDDCLASVAEICLKADGGVIFDDFNSSVGCVNGFQSIFSFTNSSTAAFIVQVTVSYNNGCPEQVVYATIGGSGGTND